MYTEVVTIVTLVSIDVIIDTKIKNNKNKFTQYWAFEYIYLTIWVKLSLNY